MCCVRAEFATALLLLSPLAASFAQSPCPGLTAVEDGVLSATIPDLDFGTTVSISGDSVFVGSSNGNVVTALFDRTGSGWLAVASAGGARGTAIEGDRAIAGFDGFPPALMVLDRSGGTWGAPQTVLSCCTDNHDDFGWSAALDGDTAAMGVPNWGLGLGGVEVFDFAGGGWSTRYIADTALLPATWTVGRAMDLDGRWLVAPANGNKAVIFDLGPTSHTTQILKPGQEPKTSVSLSGDTLALGSPDALSLLSPRGRVYLFDHDGSSWIRGPELHPTSLTPFAQFGAGVDLQGDRLVVGAPGMKDSQGVEVGGFYAFQRVGQSWIEVGHILGDPSNALNLGAGVALDGDRVVIGARGEARVFDLELNLPATAYCTAGTTASGCRALISATGVPSASAATGFVVNVSGSEGQKDGTLYFGTSGAQANSWGTGSSFQCVEPPVTRTGVLPGSGTIATCDGSFALDFNAWMAANPARAPQPGTTTYLQTWFRDPFSTSNQSTSLSDALVFTVCQ